MFKLTYFGMGLNQIYTVKVPAGATRVYFSNITTNPKGPNPLYTNSVRFDLETSVAKGTLASYFGSDVLVLGGWVPIDRQTKFISMYPSGTTKILGPAAIFELPG